MWNLVFYFTFKFSLYGSHMQPDQLTIRLMSKIEYYMSHILDIEYNI